MKLINQVIAVSVILLMTACSEKAQVTPGTGAGSAPATSGQNTSTTRPERAEGTRMHLEPIPAEKFKDPAPDWSEGKPKPLAPIPAEKFRDPPKPADARGADSTPGGAR